MFAYMMLDLSVVSQHSSLREMIFGIWKFPLWTMTIQIRSNWIKRLSRSDKQKAQHSVSRRNLSSFLTTGTT